MNKKRYRELRDVAVAKAKSAAKTRYVLGAIVLLVMVCSSGRSHLTQIALAECPYCQPPTGAYTIATPGLCNSVVWDQVPGNPDLFVGRSTVAGPGACDESQGYKLIVARMDWSTHTLSVVNQNLFVGPQWVNPNYQITTAYDATLMLAHDELWAAFECAGPGMDAASSCMGPVVTNGDQSGAQWYIDPARTTVVVAGNRIGSEIHSASVPKIFYWHGEPYMYYTVIDLSNCQPDDSGCQQNYTATRGIQLRWDIDSQLFWELQSSAPVGAVDWHSAEVMKPDPGDPLSNQVVDGSGVYTDGPPGAEWNIYMTGSIGGNTNQPCLITTGGLNFNSLGCYRSFIARSSTPLGEQVFNDYRVADRVLPQNSVEYLRRYWDPTQGWSLMAYFSPAPPGAPFNVWPSSAIWGYPSDLSSLSYDLTHPWWYETTTWVMNPGERLNLPNGFLQYQGDGNLVLYNAYSTPLWSTGTSGPDYCASGRCRAQFQGDGNLVLYRDYLDGNTHYWASGTDGIGHILIFGIRPSFYHLGIQDYSWQWVFCDDHRCGP